MQSVEQIAQQIVMREGGYVNDPDDPGGATNFGVTIGTMKTLGMDLNKDGRIDVSDVRALTRAQAENIFVEHYFRKPRLAELPQSVQASVFYMYVNAGTNAVTILQKLVTRMGFAASADGAVGPMESQGSLRRFRYLSFISSSLNASVGVRHPRHFLGVPFKRSQIDFISRFESAATGASRGR